MKAINLYVLSRNVNPDLLEEYEIALSGRDDEKQFRPEEVEIIRLLTEKMILLNADPDLFDGWFYGFTIPQIGKEFDLLRIGSKTIVNVEFKGQWVDLEKIGAQLEKNRHYLTHLSRKICSFTIVRDWDGELCLFTLEDGVLSECSFELLLEKVAEDRIYTENHIEDLFDPCVYLVSPVNTPERFLKGEYFLNNQQTAIKKQILEHESDGGLFGIRGSAGTGKSMLLYDMAFTLGRERKACIIHSGTLLKGHRHLQNYSENIQVCSSWTVTEKMLKDYDVVCVDESQRMGSDVLDMVLKIHDEKPGRLAVFAYDALQALTDEEVERDIPSRLCSIEGFTEYRLTNRVRSNNEITSFIRTMLRLRDLPRKYTEYNHVDIIYANNEEESVPILDLYLEKGFKFITLAFSRNKEESPEPQEAVVSSRQVIGQEYDKVVVIIDSSFRYNENGELEGTKHPDPHSLFARLLYQNITRARSRLCVIVLNNPDVFRNLLRIKNHRLGRML